MVTPNNEATRSTTGAPAPSERSDRLGGPPVVVVGCSDVGACVAAEARRRGRTAWGTTRRPERAEELERAGILGCVFDPEAPDEPPRLPIDRADAVVCVPPARDGSHQTAHAIVDWLARHGTRRIVYLSATSVYEGGEGDVVTAATPTHPDTDRGRRRLDDERAYAQRCEAAEIEFVTLRLPGIYGPGRTIRDRLEAGTYVVANPDLITNRIFVDDIATAAMTLLEAESPASAYLASDGNPFAAVDMARWASRALGLDPPRVGTLDDASPRARSFWKGSKRCDPSALMELGWTPAFPTWRDGLIEAWRREGRPVAAPPPPPDAAAGGGA